MLESTLLHFLFTLVVFYLCFFVGHVLSSLMKHNEGNSIFSKLALGIISIITIYAVLITKGKSIFSLGIILTAVYLLLSKMHLNTNEFIRNFRKLNPQLYIGLLIPLVFFVIQFSLFYDFTNLEHKLINPDYAFYSRLAVFLREFGVENTTISYFGNIPNGVLPYHYAEIWFASFVGDLLGVHNQQALNLITYAVFYSVIYFGAIDLIRVVKNQLKLPSNTSDYFLGFLILFIGFWAFLYPTNIQVLQMDVWVIKLTELNKLVFIYLLAIPILISIINKKFFQVSFLVSLLVIGYVSVAPSVFLTIGLYFLSLYFLKHINFRKLLTLFLPLIITVLYFYFFYSFFGVKSNVTLESGEFLQQFYDLKYYKTMVNVFGKMTIQIMIVSFPIMLILILNRRKISSNYNPILIFVSLLVFMSLAIWAVLWKMHDSVQLYSNVSNPFINLLLFILIINIILKVSNIWRLVLISIIVVAGSIDLINNKSKDSYTLVDKELQEKVEKLSANSTFAYFKQSSDYTTRFNKVESVYSGQLRNLMRGVDNFKAVCLTPHLIPISEEVESNFVKSLPFYKYTDSLQNVQEISVEECQVVFLEKYKVDYVLMNNERALPEYLMKEYHHKPIFSLDGYAFYPRLVGNKREN